MITDTSQALKYKNVIILFTIAAILNLEVWKQDLTQAYIQRQYLQRDVYENPHRNAN